MAGIFIGFALPQVAEADTPQPMDALQEVIVV